ncbi:Cu+-exporting ATPase [Mesonia hippocampi]|uniref:Cu+-exporting ATPase n=1 Tax=Mesonia hippocampi TaxID=1628250 RepID=A0A840F1D2_9FLAO|nr:heavy metal translocating P-type ATPase metal-binding domain-containing protein [Mesonia hippocampi]MBB4120064.1 Cu+-exporting ATPase [Mesonia hippocampi]
MEASCYHCGDSCGKHPIVFDEKKFCCTGCKTVYELFSENDLSCYYDYAEQAGTTPEVTEKYTFLDKPEIIEKLLEFEDANIAVVNLYIPHIHCSSCIWLLENLQKLNDNIRHSQVDFPKKTVRITYKTEAYTLRELVSLLGKIGYTPYISLENLDKKKTKTDRSLFYKLGIAGFAFGNVMFLSFPEYFEVSEFWLDRYKHVFRWVMFAFSLPVVFYAAQDYFIAAYKGLRAKSLTIDVPIALGIIVLFIRSTTEIVLDIGSGFFDSLTGLVFFLLVGKFFQQKTYAFLSFERDYKSYFPIAVTRVKHQSGKIIEESIQVYEIQNGDHLLIRHNELLPVDAKLLSPEALLDYSFVTGESKSVAKTVGEKLFAGGKQLEGAIEVEALAAVEQSYLTKLWSQEIFSKDKDASYKNIITKVSRHFTWIVLLIAFVSTAIWLYLDASQALQVFTAVLIIACPCALALSAPFTLGNMLRIFGYQKFYLKNAQVIEKLAQADTLVFDKTGTMTSQEEKQITYEGVALTPEEQSLLTASLRSSNHPLSRSLYSFLQSQNITTLDSFSEEIGKGITAIKGKQEIKIGSANFVGIQTDNKLEETSVYIKMQPDYKGKYIFVNKYRKGLQTLFRRLKNNYHLVILSGDNDSQREKLMQILPSETQMFFKQSPEDKLNYIKRLQAEGKKVVMIGDGLNDAGALAQSDVGIALSENTNVFSPACDAILDATKFAALDTFLKASKKTIHIIKASFMLSFFYNVIGLYFAVTGQLSPVIAAILMPLSSISVLAFVTVYANVSAKKMGL